MFRNASLTVLATMFLCSTVALAKAPAAAPAGTTGMCKDGSYTSAASKSGACSGHDGVKKWYGAAADASTAAPAATGADMGASSAKSKKKADATATAAATTAAPAAGATGTCKDGTSTSAASKSGACSGHGGVKDWNGAAGATSAAAATAPAPMSKSAAAPAMSASPAMSAAPAKSTGSAPSATAAPGGGPGQVWVNKPSKVYHCPNDQWYGKTKDGAYMTEANAIAQGYHADHGKACQ
jgi:Protein of unknown function (DUF3761)